MSLLTHLFRFIRRYFRKKAEDEKRHQEVVKKLTSSMEHNLALIEKGLGGSDDFVRKKLVMNWSPSVTVRSAVVYIDGMADHQVVQQTLLSSLLDRRPTPEELKSMSVTDIIKTKVLATATGQDVGDVQEALLSLLSGSVLILVEGSKTAISVPVQGWPDREVAESMAQTVVRGPQDAFTENISKNITLVRRRIRDPRVRCVQKTAGTVTRTRVVVMYLDGMADDRMVKDLLTRLDAISLESVLDGEYIEESISDSPYSLFPTVYNTDRPDAVCTELLQGRISIMVDGSPFVLVVPALFTDFLQSAEDHYQSYYYSSLIRILRFVALLFATFSPSIYIALTTFDQEMLPTSLLFSLAAQREGTPFPAFAEALLMEVTFEILREAGIRMPRTIGQAVSIVGTIVIGQAAVDAGIVSAGMVIVVSLTAISSFAIPSYDLGIAARIVRFFFMLLAASFGLYGLFVGLIVLVIHLCSLRSMGVPYMAPFAPKRNLKQYDAVIRVPYWLSKRR